VPPELTEYVASAYVRLRQEEATRPDPHSYTTARTLLSILRLSQALACRLSTVLSPC
jgi:DNA replication licensing factor MCM7